MAKQPKPDTATDNQKVFSVRIDPVLIRRIKVHAVLSDRSMRSVATQAFEEFLESHNHDTNET